MKKTRSSAHGPVLGKGEGEGGIEALTIRERRFLLAYIEKGTLKDAALAIDSHASDVAARVAGHTYWKNIKRKVDIEALMEDVGLSKVRIFRKINEALDAKVVKPFLSKDGGIVESPEYVDHLTRVKAADVAAKIMGIIVEKREHSGTDGQPLTFRVVYDDKPKPDDGT